VSPIEDRAQYRGIIASTGGAATATGRSAPTFGRRKRRCGERGDIVDEAIRVWAARIRRAHRARASRLARLSWSTMAPLTGGVWSYLIHLTYADDCCDESTELWRNVR